MHVIHVLCNNGKKVVSSKASHTLHNPELNSLDISGSVSDSEAVDSGAVNRSNKQG